MSVERPGVDALGSGGGPERDAKAGLLAWLEDPHLGVLTPGQRYTAVIVFILAVLMMTIGVPRGSSGRVPNGGSPAITQTPSQR